LRGANDKYKGILAFRATLSNLRADERRYELFSALAAVEPTSKVTFFASPLAIWIGWRQPAPLQLLPDNFSCGTRYDNVITKQV
jgi:hypothetical protein